MPGDDDESQPEATPKNTMTIIVLAIEGLLNTFIILLASCREEGT
jgi:hypothetical protein